MQIQTFGGDDRVVVSSDSLSSLTKWLSLTTMTWSRHSQRRIPTNLSAIAFAFGLNSDRLLPPDTTLTDPVRPKGMSTTVTESAIAIQAMR